MKKCTLQLRITIIAGLILMCACLLLTVNSLLSANNYYGDYADLIESGMVEYDTAILENQTMQKLTPDISYQDAAQKFSLQSVTVMALIVVLALAAIYLAAGRVLKPLKELTQSVKAVDDRNLDKRVVVSEAQGEVLALAESFNRMLERLESAFLIQKSFASNAAHELKTPLAVIKSSIQVLEMNQQPEREDYQDFMEATGQSLERIIKTVDGLMSLANLAAAPTDTAVALYPLIEQAIGELSVQAGQSHVELMVSGEETLTVCGNPALLYRTFYNLIENAVKYNKPGGKAAVSLQQEKDKVMIQVSDEGIGMAADEIPHIFEPFYRADKSRSQHIPGSGLGLAIVKMILERHGGEIQVNSELGGGSVFTITLYRDGENK